MSQVSARGRWTGDTFVVAGSVVGVVTFASEGRWFAAGCLSDWQDTPLGQFTTRLQARRAVEHWVREAS